MAGMAAPTIRQITSRELKRVLSATGWDDARAAKAMGLKDRRQLLRYKSGKAVTPIERLDALSVASGIPITLLVGHEEAALPIYWARRLREDADAVIALLEDDPPADRSVDAVATNETPSAPADDAASDGPGPLTPAHGTEHKPPLDR